MLLRQRLAEVIVVLVTMMLLQLLLLSLHRTRWLLGLILLLRGWRWQRLLLLWQVLQLTREAVEQALHDVLELGLAVVVALLLVPKLPLQAQQLAQR